MIESYLTVVTLLHAYCVYACVKKCALHYRHRAYQSMITQAFIGCMTALGMMTVYVMIHPMIEHALVASLATGIFVGNYNHKFNSRVR